MAVPTMDFDWLLDHASAIAFDPGRPSIYVFGLDMTPEELREQVLSPMEQHDLFAVAQAKFIDDNQRGRYKGQLPRVASMCHARMRLPTPSWRHWQWMVLASSKFPSLSTSRCRRPHQPAPAATKYCVRVLRPATA